MHNPHLNGALDVCVGVMYAFFTACNNFGSDVLSGQTSILLMKYFNIHSHDFSMIVPFKATVLLFRLFPAMMVWMLPSDEEVHAVSTQKIETCDIAKDLHANSPPLTPSF